MQGPRKIAICGPSRSGKDEASAWLAAHTDMIFAGSASRFLLPYIVERRHGVTRDSPRYGAYAQVAWEDRHDDREYWYEVGNELRAKDPLVLVRQVLECGDILCGCRDGIEIVRAKESGLIDLAIWIDRDVPPDPTMTYGVELCDVVVPNRWDLPAYRARLAALIKFTGMTLIDPSASLTSP